MKRITQKSPAHTLHAVVKIVPTYQDCDPAGVVWHGNYFHYFDTARCALLDQIDYGYRQMAAEGHVWPIIDTRVRYMGKATYDQPLQVSATLTEWEYRLRMDFEVLDDSGECITEAYTVQVAIEIETDELCLGSPDALLKRLRQLGIN